MMTKQQGVEWIEALESGEYDQARHSLYEVGVGYCCLGVACKVVFGAPEDAMANMGDPSEAGYYLELGNVPEECFVGMFGVDDDGNVALPEEWIDPDGVDLGAAFIYMNDDLLWDFQRIAAWAREHVLPRLPEAA
jgi:hypothetical protein